MSYYDNMPIGQIVSRMLRTSHVSANLWPGGLVDGAWAVAYMTGVIVVMLVLNLGLAFIVIVSVPLIVLLSLNFQKRILSAQREARKHNAAIIAAFNEGIMGATTTKTLLFEEENLSQFQGRTASMRDASMRAAKYSSIYLPIVLLIGNACMAGVLWNGGAKVMLGVLTLGTLATFVNYATGFFEPVNNLAAIFAELQAAQAAAERVTDLLTHEVRIVDRPDVAETFGTVFSPRRENWPKMTGHVEFDDVSFEYTDGVPVLEHFNLDAKPGMQIALVGETGSGKTTISQLLGRFYELSAEACGLTAPTRGILAFPISSQISAMCCRRRICFPGRCATISATAARTRRIPKSRKPRKSRSPTSLSAA